MAVDHLLVNDAGDKLIIKSNKLVTVDDPDDCECCDAAAECPSDCSACDDPIVATVTGVDGGAQQCGFGTKDCSNVNQTYSMPKSGCTWTGAGTTDTDYTGTITCNGTIDQWEFEITCVIGTPSLFRVAASACPPASGWTRVGGNCTNGAVTMS